MKKRSVVAVILLTFVTLFIYHIVWLIKTKREMKDTVGANIVTGWILLIPYIGLFYYWWSWSKGVETFTRGKLSQVISFILMFVCSPIGMAIVQSKFNETIDEGQMPQAKVA
jgi:cellobiose-specific phosphotransferase system component IIC